MPCVAVELVALSFNMLQWSVVEGSDGVLCLGFTFYSKLAAVARRAFAQVHVVHQLCPFLDQDALTHSNSHFSSPV